MISITSHGRFIVIVLLIALIMFSELYSVEYSSLKAETDLKIKPFGNNTWQYLHKNGDSFSSNSSEGSSLDSDYLYSGESQSWKSEALAANQAVWGIYAHLKMSAHVRGVGENYVAINGSDSDKSGWNITVGDVNGDGIDDIIIGAPFNNSADGSKKDAGAVYIFFGYPGINENRFKSTFPNANVTIYGSVAGDYFGWSVSSGKDVNGDGIDDLIIGAPGNDTSKENTTLTYCGRAYLFFGNSSWSSSTKYTYHDTDANVVITGEQAGEKLGFSVALLGDMNGEGGNETGIGAPYYNSSLTNIGRVYIFDNRSTWNSVYNSSNADSNWTGEVAGGLFGFSIANGGDFNKDGYDDCVVGAPGADRAYVYYGSLGLQPQEYYTILTNKTDFDSQALHRLQVNYPETAGNDYGEPENANVSLVNLASGTTVKTVPNDGLPSDVDGVPDFYDEANSTGSINDTVVNDSSYWDIKEKEGYANYSVTSEENDYGIVSPTTDGYQQTWQSDNNYESIEEVSHMCTIWDDGFETNKSWTGYGGPGEWQRAKPEGLGVGSGGNPDPSQAYSGNYVLGTDLTYDGNYSNNLGKTYNITSPAINCSGYTNISLVFWAWLNVEGGGYDHAYVYVSNDSVNWVQIFTNNGYYCDDEWKMMMFDISNVADNQNTVYIRFGIGPTDSSNNFTGWNIDDVQLIGNMKVYTVDFSTDAGSANFSKDPISDRYADVAASSSTPYGSPETGGTEFSSTDYSDIAASDDTYVAYGVNGGGYVIYHFNFTLNTSTLSLSSIKALYFYFEGYGTTYLPQLYVWNWTSESYEEHSPNMGYTADNCFYFSLTSGLTDYINQTTGTIHFEATDDVGSTDTFYADYVQMKILYQQASTYSLEHKWFINLPESSAVDVYVEAHTTGEGFKFYTNFSDGSVDDGMYMFNVTATSDTLYHYSFGSFSGGNFSIGVIDTNHHSTDTTPDVIYVDNIKIRIYVANPRSDVEFKVSGLNATYSYMRLNVTGYKSDDEDLYVYIWNETQAGWVNASNYISIGSTVGTYVSTTTKLYQNITSDGVLYIRFVNEPPPSSSTQTYAWLNLTFVGIDMESSQSTFYADSGYFTKMANFGTNTSVQKVMASWNVSNEISEKSITKTAIGSTADQLEVPFAGSTYSTFKCQLLYLQSDINQYGVINDIAFEKTDSTTATYNLQVYFVEVKRSQLSTNFYDNYEGNPPTEVFDGNVTFTGGQYTWFPIELNHPFIYHNNTNLLIEIRYSGATTDVYTYGDSATNRCLYSSSLSASTGSLSFGYINTLRFNINRPPNFGVYVTRNGGKNWHEIENNEIFVFPNSDEEPYTEFNYKVTFCSENSTRDDTPILHDIKFTIYVAILTRSPTPLFGAKNTSFGWSVDGVGDVNNGGKDDVIVGAPNYPYITYNFENYTVGSKPPDWDINEDSGTSVSVIAGKHLQIQDTSTSGTVNASRHFPSPSNTLIVGFEINITHKGWFNIMLTNDYLYTYSLPTHYFATQLYFNDSDMNIYWYNGTDHVIQPWSTNTTYNIKFIVNLTSQLWGIYINGSLVYEGAKFLNSADNITRIYFGSDGDTNVVTAWIDNVYIPLRPSTGEASLYFGENTVQNYSKSYVTQDDYRYGESSLSFSNPNKNMYVTNYTPDAYLNLSGTNALADNVDGLTASWTTVGSGGSMTTSTNTSVSPTHSYHVTDTSTSDYIQEYASVTYPSQYAVSLWFNVTQMGDDQFSVDYYSGTSLYLIWGVGIIDGKLQWEYDVNVWVDCQTPVTISTNKWYWIYIIADSTTDTYDIYVNGSKVQEGATFVDTTDTPNRFYLADTYNTPSGDSGTISIYYDDIYISTYASTNYYESSAIQLPGYVAAVQFSMDKCVPDDTTYSFYVSRDGGKTWTNISAYETVEYWFTSAPAGKDFRFNITMNGNGYASPALWDIQITITYVVSGVVINGSKSGDMFGYSVSGGGNIANDSTIPDIIIGAPGNNSSDGSKADAGAIYVFSGREDWRSEYNATDAYYIFYGEDAGDKMGFAVDGENMDLLGDGYPNFAATTPYFDNGSAINCGRTYIFRLVGLGGQIGSMGITITLNSQQTGFVGMARFSVKGLKVYNVSMYAYNAISMPTQDDVWIVGEGGLIVNTSSFTSSTPYWYLQDSGTTANLYSISMASTTSGIVCGDGVILYTTDGKTWQNTTTNVSGYVWRSVYYNGTDAWAVGTATGGSGYEILYSSDGGDTWSVNASSTSSSLYSIDFYGKFGVAVGDGTILYTTDGGSTWSAPSTYDNSVKYNSVVVVSSSEAFAVANLGKIFQTTDTSSTWSEMSSPTYQNLYDISALSASNIIAVGDNGTILRYNGSTWINEDITNATRPLYSVYMYSSSLYGAVGDSANILKYDSLWIIRYLPKNDILNFTISVNGSYSGAYATLYYNSSYSNNSNYEFKALGDARCEWVKSLKSSDGTTWLYTNEWSYRYTSGEYMGFEANVSTGNLGYTNITKVVMEIYAFNGTRMYTNVLTTIYQHGDKNATYRITNIDYSTWAPGRYYAIFTAYDMDSANDYQAGPCDEKISWFYIS